MDRLEPIPSPPGHLVREFCHRALPLLTFIAAAAGTAVLWNQRFTGTLLHGEVEPIHASVTSLDSGTVTSVHVDRWQEVTNQQPIATLQIVDADAVGRAVETARTELYLMRSRMALDVARNKQNIESLRVRWLEARVALATARIALENARRELERADRLRKENIVPQAEFDDAQAMHDALRAEVDERSRLANGLQSAVKSLESEAEQGESDAVSVIEKSLSAQEAELEHQGTQVLRAPMAGIVRNLTIVPGERIAAGTVIAEITSPHSERIIGYIRQPITLEPQPGMTVEIRTRGAVRQVGQSRIVDVGPDLETVRSPLRLQGVDNAMERGLAFSLPVPHNLKVYPGELVDLVVRPTSTSKVP